MYLRSLAFFFQAYSCLYRTHCECSHLCVIFSFVVLMHIPLCWIIHVGWPRLLDDASAFATLCFLIGEDSQFFTNELSYSLQYMHNVFQCSFHTHTSLLNSSFVEVLDCQMVGSIWQIFDITLLSFFAQIFDITFMYTSRYACISSLAWNIIVFMNEVFFEPTSSKIKSQLLWIFFVRKFYD